MDETFKKGDVVVIKSGGPLMTIQTRGNYPNQGIEDGALCLWFENKTRHEAVFDVATLRHYKDER